MTTRTSRIMPEYYYDIDESVNANNNNNNSRDYPYITSNNTTGSMTHRSKYGQYNIIEKELDDCKVSYYIPSEYANNYDISQLDAISNDHEQQRYNTPRLIKRTYYRQYPEDGNYREELPRISNRRYIPTVPEQPKIIKRIYIRPSPTPPPQTVEYVYEDDYRPTKEEYVVPRQRYIEESQPVDRSVYEENLPIVHRSPQHFVPPHSPSPRALPRSPIKPLRFNEFVSPRHSNSNQQTPRTTTLHESANRTLPQIYNKPKHLSLKEVLAQNRAKRGSRIPIPRREIDEEQLHDLPTYRKNYVKNGFIVHK